MLLAVVATLHIYRVHTRHTVVAVVATAAGCHIALLELIDKGGVVDQGTSHLNKLKALVQNPLDALTRHQTANIYQRALECCTELLGILQEVANSTNVDGRSKL